MSRYEFHEDQGLVFDEEWAYALERILRSLVVPVQLAVVVDGPPDTSDDVDTMLAAVDARILASPVPELWEIWKRGTPAHDTAVLRILVDRVGEADPVVLRDMVFEAHRFLAACTSSTNDFRLSIALLVGALRRWAAAGADMDALEELLAREKSTVAAGLSRYLSSVGSTDLNTCGELVLAATALVWYTADVRDQQHGWKGRRRSHRMVNEFAELVMSVAEWAADQGASAACLVPALSCFVSAWACDSARFVPEAGSLLNRSVVVCTRLWDVVDGAAAVTSVPDLRGLRLVLRALAWVCSSTDATHPLRPAVERLELVPRAVQVIRRLRSAPFSDEVVRWALRVLDSVFYGQKSLDDALKRQTVLEDPDFIPLVCLSAAPPVLVDPATPSAVAAEACPPGMSNDTDDADGECDAVEVSGRPALRGGSRRRGGETSSNSLRWT